MSWLHGAAKRGWRAALPVLGVAVAACAPILPPSVLVQADGMPKTPAMVQPQKHAPIPFAQAEQLRQQAHAAFEEGDFAASQILAEQALAAY